MNGISNASAVKLLQEMQAMADKARSSDPAGPDKGRVDFAGVLGNAINQVNDLQMDAGRKTDAFARGDNIPLTDVMISLQKSRVSFEALTQVRNHLVQAYKDVFNMPV